MFENGSFLRRRKRFKVVGGKRVQIMDSDEETVDEKPKEKVDDTNYKPPTISQLSGVVPPPVPDIHSFVNNHFQVIFVISFKNVTEKSLKSKVTFLKTLL